MTDTDFIHLHTHSIYSIQDSLLKIDDIFKATIKNNLKAIAITDHGSLCGVSEFNLKSKNYDIKPIFGLEAYVEPLYEARTKTGKEKINAHLILIAKNKVGYSNLIKIHNHAWQNFYYKPRTTYDFIEKYKEGLICSTACIGGDLNNALKTSENDFKEFIAKMDGIFGDDFYLEIQDISNLDTKKLNSEIIKNGHKYIITTDVHYLNKEDFQTHNILMLMKEKKTIKDLEEGHAFTYKTDDLYYKSPEELKKNYDEVIWNNCLKSCCEIYEKIDKYSIFDKIHLPVISEDPEGDIKKYIFNNRHKIPKGEENIYYNRIKEELRIYKVTNSLNYLLIVKDFIEHGKSKDFIFNYGRGSACSSLIGYMLDIHQIDPIKSKLFFKRFLNENRGIKMKVF